MTVVDTALRDALRALKLSGMLDTLDARLAQARGGELGHLEFVVERAAFQSAKPEGHQDPERAESASGLQDPDVDQPVVHPGPLRRGEAGR